MKTFQSTLPREERRKSTRANRSSVKISIHASTRGATQFLSLVSSRLQISIHASTRGATNRKSYNGERKTISIHASTRGATFTVALNSNPFQFQSTLPREERRVRRQRIRKRIRFQSTLPREERPYR